MARRVVKRRLTASYSADDPERIEVSQSGYGNMVRDLRAAELFRVCSRISGKKRRQVQSAVLLPRPRHPNSLCIYILTTYRGHAMTAILAHRGASSGDGP